MTDTELEKKSKKALRLLKKIYKEIEEIREYCEYAENLSKEVSFQSLWKTFIKENPVTNALLWRVKDLNNR